MHEDDGFHVCLRMHTHAHVNTPKAMAWTPWRAEVNEVPAGADQAAPPQWTFPDADRLQIFVACHV